MRTVHVKGAEVPALGFGTYQLAGTVCERMVRTALDIGYRHIDTAQIYGNEGEVGRAIGASGIPREDIFLTTKVWMTRLAYDDVLRSMEESLRKLATDYVDLTLIHWPNEAIPLGETLKALAALKRDGKTRFIGVSNFTVRLMDEAISRYDADLLCNQVEYHPMLSQEPVLAFVRANGMMLTAYSPLAQGRVKDDPILIDVGRRHGKSPAQVALRWLLDQPGVVAIPKASSEARARENFDIEDFALTEHDRRDIGRLSGNSRVIDPDWAPEWDVPGTS